MGLKEGDALIDVSTNIEFLEIWPLCAHNGVMYSNTAQEVWIDSEDAASYPKSLEEMYRGSLGHTRDELEKLPYWHNKTVHTI